MLQVKPGRSVLSNSRNKFVKPGRSLLAKPNKCTLHCFNLITLPNYLLGRGRRGCHPCARLVTVTTSATRFGGTHNNGHKADAEDEEYEAGEAAEVALADVVDAVRLRGNFRKSGALLPSVRISTGNL